MLTDIHALADPLCVREQISTTSMVESGVVDKAMTGVQFF
jgi:hypothetical protein